MPVVRSDSQRKEAATVARTDSLRSERSDKRVSFNKDVGIKHIPRGLKDQPKPKLPKDEWSNCIPVHLEKPTLSSKELGQQAEDLVRLLDQVACISDTKPINNQDNKVNIKNNTKNRANNIKVINTKNNLVDSLGRSSRPNNSSINDARTKNSIEYSNKNNVNLNRHRQLNKINNNQAIERRALSAHSTTDINDSDQDNSYEKYSSIYKSVPDLQTTIYYDNDNRDLKDYSHLIDHSDRDKNSMSVDNLYDSQGRRLANTKSYKKNRNEYLSADNLTDVSIPGTRKLKEYKPYENLRNGFSSVTDLKFNDSRPNIENIIKKINSENSDHKVLTHKISIERDDKNNSRTYMKPNSQNLHNNNKPFSYTSAPLSSVEAVRRVSPIRDSYKAKDDYYNRNRRLARSTSREYEPNCRDSDYSAKIIITDCSNQYDDDHAYETYQVGANTFSKPTKEYGISSGSLLNGYKDYSSNNMNMSSIGVQTDGLPKAPLRSRRNVKSLSPIRGDLRNGYGDELPSASLVRRINQGFGHVDRSPSPPTHKLQSTRNVRRSVVPLLSDTDESEFDYHRRTDPLAKIRKQVMIREKLQEEKEAEEREELLFEMQQNTLKKLNSSDLQPLTVDEVDALTLEVDKQGTNKLVVAHEKSSNDQHRQTENYSSRTRSATPKGRKSPETNNKRTTSPGIFSTLERLKKNNADKGKGTLKKKKKIKIKFFYDPRPQDKPNEDPLEHYTEYRGRETSSPKVRRRSNEDDAYENYYRDTKNEFRSLPRESYLAREERRQKIERIDSFNRNISPSRPLRVRNTSRDTSLDTSKGRSVRDSSSEITRQDSKTARDYRNNKLNSESRYNYNSINRSKDINDRDKRPDNDQFSYNSRDKSHHQVKESSEHFNSIRDKFSSNRKNNYDSQESLNRKKFNYYDSDHHESSDQGGGPSLSDKYKHLRNSDDAPTNIKYNFDDEAKMSDIEESNKNKKILRQRNKFLGVLMGDGRSKSPAGKRIVTKESSPKIDARKNETKNESRPYLIENPSDKAKNKGFVSRPYIARDREADNRETHQWESAATLSRNEVRVKKRAPSPPRNQRREVKYVTESSPTSTTTATPVGARVGRTSSFQQKYLGDSDNDTITKRRPILTNTITGIDNYGSLPNPNRRLGRTAYGAKQNLIGRRGTGMRKISPGARGSAGSSLQSSESEADSHQGSHASRASHISTGSNRSVYLHATAVADIPVHRHSDENSDIGPSRQTKKVARSFSMATPWKPRSNKDRYEIEYDNREIRDIKPERKSALPPRAPRKSPDPYSNSNVNRSQTIYKDSKLAGWLRRRRNKEIKGI